MKSFAEESLPTSDRPERSADPSLLTQLKEVVKREHLSNADIGRHIRYSSAAVSTYLNDKYHGGLTAIEPRIREWLLKGKMEASSGVTIVDTEVSRLICDQLEATSRNGQLVVITDRKSTRLNSSHLGI